MEMCKRITADCMKCLKYYFFIQLNANCFSIFIAKKKKKKNYKERKKNWRLKRRDIDKEVDR